MYCNYIVTDACLKLCLVNQQNVSAVLHSWIITDNDNALSFNKPEEESLCTFPVRKWQIFKNINLL